MNYVSMSLRGSRSETLPLFNPRSPYYHAWFCVYAAIGNTKPFGFEQGRPIPSAVFSLALADQDYWRRIITGDSIVESQCTYQSEAEEVKLPHLGNRVFMFRGRFSSYSVLTRREEQTSKGRHYFALPEESEWNTLVDPCHSFTQGGVGVIWSDDRSGVTFIAGGIGASFVDKSGTHYDYIPFVEAEILTLLEGLRFRPLWRK
jgi:hypothetical protein